MGREMIELGCKLVRVAVAVTLTMPLGCSGGASNDDGARETPLELPETLRITVRNDSDRVQYLDNVGFWLRSDSDQVRNFDLGDAEPPVDLAMASNQPTCQQISSGELSCGDHGDRQASVLVLTPGAEYSEDWSAEVWRRSSAEADSDCACVEPVEAPAGAYLVSVGVSASVTCDGSSCECQPGESSCVVLGRASEPEPRELPVTWPDQGEVVLVLE